MLLKPEGIWPTAQHPHPDATCFLLTKGGYSEGDSNLTVCGWGEVGAGLGGRDYKRI